MYSIDFREWRDTSVGSDAQPLLFSFHLPKHVSRKEFNRSIAPYLTKPQNGPKPKLSLYKLFNYVLLVLHTGIHWRELQTRGHELHWTNVYKWHKRWSKDGCYDALLHASLPDLLNSTQLDANASGTQSWMSSWGLCLKMQSPAASVRVGRGTRGKGSSRHAITISSEGDAARDVWRILCSYSSTCLAPGRSR